MGCFEELDLCPLQRGRPVGLGSHLGQSKLMPGRLMHSGVRWVVAARRQACTPSVGSGQENTCVLWTHIQVSGTRHPGGQGPTCVLPGVQTKYSVWAAMARGRFVYESFHMSLL